jgi:hypothetical protein
LDFSRKTWLMEDLETSRQRRGLVETEAILVRPWHDLGAVFGTTLSRLWLYLGATVVCPLRDLGAPVAPPSRDLGATATRPWPDLGQTLARPWQGLCLRNVAQPWSVFFCFYLFDLVQFELDIELG